MKWIQNPKYNKKMGVRGQRHNILNRTYQEPDLIVGIDSILGKANNIHAYTEDSLNLNEVISSCFPDIEISYEDMDPEQSGKMKHINGKWIMSINSRHNKKRQKFTIAHELGHYLLHKDKDIEYIDTTFFRNKELNSVEYLANEFAAKLLMPENRVRHAIDSGDKNIGHLAERFGVSASAMKYRIISLGYKLKSHV
jgi:Zn-dependent peptidase ImmA (M78 family)